MVKIDLRRGLEHLASFGVGCAQSEEAGRMRMIDALVGLRDDQYNGCRRACWAPHVVVMKDADRRMYLVNTSRSVKYPYDPHSVDRGADDWEAVFVYTEPTGLRIEVAGW
jgi:hypothetical protein